MSEYTPIPVHETSPGSFTVQFPKDTMTGKFEREEAGMTNKLTTEEVRDDYQWGVNACGCCAEREEIDLDRFDAWLAEAVRQAKAEAWDECCDEVSMQGTVQLPDNPYTEEREKING